MKRISAKRKNHKKAKQLSLQTLILVLLVFFISIVAGHIYFSKSNPPYQSKALTPPGNYIPPCAVGTDPRYFVLGIAMPMGAHGGPPYPGTYGSTYYYPTAANYKYYASHGIRLVRFSFNWERLQRQPAPIPLAPPYVALDTQELSRMDASIAEAAKLGMKVVLDPHNFARYYGSDGKAYRIGGPNFVSGVKTEENLPVPFYSDFMKKLAQHYAGNPTVYAYSLMNEPVKDNGVWNSTAAQAGINAIRTYDHTHIIHVPTSNWDLIPAWLRYNSSFRVSDPDNKFAYEGHIYFNYHETNVHGYLTPFPSIYTYPDPTYNFTNPSQIGPALLAGWVAWLRNQNAIGFISEFGFPDNDQGYSGNVRGLNYNPEYSLASTARDYNAWLVVMDSTLAYMKTQGIGGLVWWGDDDAPYDPLNLEPRPTGPVATVGPTQFIGKDKPMMAILQKYIPKICITPTP